MPQQIIDIAYLIAAVLFIFGLKMLCSPSTARKGNFISSVGMLIAIIFTLSSKGILSFSLIIIGLLIGSFLGALLAITVKMTAMPQMVGILNGFGGLASALVAIAEWIRKRQYFADMENSFVFTVFLSILIGLVTFTGSVVAAAKLQGLIPGRPIVFRGNQLLNIILLIITIGFGIALIQHSNLGWLLIPIIAIASVLGVLTVIPIGGADMPVVICLLNSYSGLAASATGFVLSNMVLIISGALVGASGIILTGIMCKAMNRSVMNVLIGGFGVDEATAKASIGKTVRNYTPEDAAIVLGAAKLVIIIPGYGMAVSQAQHAVRDLANLLQKMNIEVKYAIHPVAGRMPGHMNVLLAEADVPYSQQYTMDEINPEFEHCDVALVIGANDVINPAAHKQPGSPIYGMPILEAEKARTIIICKRSLAPGFAGIDNELFYLEKTMMLFGNAKDTIMRITQALKE